MTGYGRAQLAAGDKLITAEVRSVNNRYFDCAVRCPRVYLLLEEPVRKAVQESGVSRGKVEVFITVEKLSGSGASVSVDLDLAKAYASALSELERELGVLNSLSTVDFIRMPDVFTVTKAEEDPGNIERDVLSVLGEALREFNGARETEGVRLCEDIAGKIGGLERELAFIEKRMPEIAAEYRERLAQKLRELLGDAGIDEGRILAEAAVFADRSSTDEEAVRLRSHLARMGEILAEGGAAGRRLDFLIQEMNREINTIGSKANDLETAQRVVDMKSTLEKIREQIQNLE